MMFQCMDWLCSLCITPDSRLSQGEKRLALAAFATSATAGGRGGLGLGEGIVTDSDLLEVDLLLAIDGLLLTDEDVLKLEDAGFLQGTTGELLTLSVLRAETQVDTLDNHVGSLADSQLDLVGALALDGGAEGAQAVELHRLTLKDEFLHTAHNVLEYQHEHVVGGELAVLREVLGEALERHGFAGGGYGEPLAEGSAVVIRVLTKVHGKSNSFSCHSWKTLSCRGAVGKKERLLPGE